MISNPAQRDGTDGTAASASSSSYLARRQGNLRRGSDGFRAPELAREPRRRAEGGHQVDPRLAPYRPNPRPPESNDRRNTPRTWAFFRPASLGAPRVNFPDRTRTQGKLQQSGRPWGSFGEPARPVLTPARNGADAPPSHSLGAFVPGRTQARGLMWRRPDSPKLYDHMPH